MIIYDMKQILTPNKYFCMFFLLNKYVTNRLIEKGKLQIESITIKMLSTLEIFRGKISLDWSGGKCFSGF